MAKWGGTTKSVILRNMENLEWGWFFPFVDFCQLWYVYYPYFKKLLWKKLNKYVFFKWFETGSQLSQTDWLFYLFSIDLFFRYLHKCKV